MTKREPWGRGSEVRDRLYEGQVSGAPGGTEGAVALQRGGVTGEILAFGWMRRVWLDFGFGGTGGNMARGLPLTPR